MLLEKVAKLGDSRLSHVSVAIKHDFFVPELDLRPFLYVEVILIASLSSSVKKEHSGKSKLT